jgi:hypothetical protein
VLFWSLSGRTPGMALLGMRSLGRSSHPMDCCAGTTTS